MKLYFINPPFKGEYGKFSRESRSPSIGHSGVLYYPLWLIYAAAYLKKEGYDVEFLDAPAKKMNFEESFKIIKETGENTKIFVVDTSTPSIYSDIKFVAELKKIYPNSFIVLVGTHPSALDIETLELNNNIDAIARKEYDLIIKNLAKALENKIDLKNVKGLTYRLNGKIYRNQDEELINNLDEIPFASQFIKEHLEVKDYFFPAASYPEIQIFTGRGCPCFCNFCVYPQLMHGRNYRARSAENVVAELEYIDKNFPDVKEIVIEDDTFTISKERVLKICNLMIEKKLHKRFKWLCNARVNLDLETMKKMKEAGCRLIIPGIESGNQNILNNIKKGTNLEQVKNYVKNAKKAGLLIHACYMVGNEGETKETMEETLKLAIELNTDTAQFFPLMPYPGTEAYNFSKKKGYINGDFENYCKEDGTHNCILNLPNLSSRELVEFCDYARKKYYLRPRYILHRLFMGIKSPSDLVRSLKAFKSMKKYLFKK